MASLELHLFGSPRALVNGKPMDVDTRKAVALLAYLAVEAHVQSRETLTALLWPDYTLEGARAALRRTLSVLHSALSPKNSPETAGSDGGWLDVSRDLVRLNAAAGYACDVVKFHAALAARREHGHPEMDVCPACLPVLKQAVALYQGDFMAGFALRDSPEFDEWQLFQQETLRQELSQALRRLSQGLAAQGDYPAGIAAARRWLALDRLQEDAHRQLMQLYAWGGDRSAALQQYQECARVLDRELGVEPLPETQALDRAIRSRQDLPQPAFQTRPAIREAPPRPVAEQPFPLVGREDQLRTLRDAYGRVGPDGFFVGVEGEPGVGKTRLVEEALARLRQAGAAILSGRAYPDQAGLAYQPLIEALRSRLPEVEAVARAGALSETWLAETARLLPELKTALPGLPAAPLLTGLSARNAFYEGLRQVTLAVTRGERPGVLFLDDLQWADESTLEWLAYLIRRLPGAPLAVIGAWRDETASHSLRLLAAAVQRSGGGQLIHLERLTAGEVAELARGTQLPEALQARLFAEAEGLPLFVTQYLRQALLAGQSGAGPEIDWSIPGGVRDLLHARLAGLDETSRQLLAAAAVIGRSFDFDLLREVSGRSETETVDSLDQLSGQGLVREPDPAQSLPVYDFSHDKLRELVYTETSLARRRLLHRRAGDALTHLARGGRERNRLAGQIARHYELAGVVDRAAQAHWDAGQAALSTFANAEALAHFNAALEEGYPDRAGIYEALGDLQTLSGKYPAARASYTQALAICRPACRFHLEQKLGNVEDRLGDWGSAEAHFQGARDAIQEEALEPAGLARLLADWSRTVYHRGEMQRAAQLAQDALAWAARSAEARAEAHAHNVLGMVSRAQEDFDSSRRHLEESLGLAERIQDLSAQIAALNNLALVNRDCGKQAEAIELTRQALELCAQIGDRHRLAALNNNLADLYYATGQTGPAMDYLKQAVQLFNEVGGEAGFTPEPWRLTEW